MALYRKYRPATFAEVVGQEHVTDPLSTALDTGRISHAYLFSGPRGCGKTSSARILARSLNCVQGPTSTPCGVCPSCVALGPGGPGNLDVIELDAASHGGVDDTRELRDRAFYAPAESRYRVFIVDEAHMVTTAGFNALLKIVEEPPAHLIFIFATTEPDKVLPTIRSRTHHYPFRLLPPATMRGLLGKICEQEQVPVEEAVYPLVIRAGGGSPRDSLSVLDQLLAGAGSEGVTYSRAVSLLGVTDVALIDDAIDALAASDGAALFGTIDSVMEAGHDPRRFAVDLLERLRDLILLQAVPDAADRGLVSGPGDVLDRMREQAERAGPATLARHAELLHEGLGEMRGATAPRLLLEIICARMLLPSVSDAESATLQRLERLERGIATGAITPTVAPTQPSDSAPATAQSARAANEPPRRRGAEILAAARREKDANRADSGPTTGPAQPDAQTSAAETAVERQDSATGQSAGQGDAGAGFAFVPGDSTVERGEAPTAAAQIPTPVDRDSSTGQLDAIEPTGVDASAGTGGAPVDAASSGQARFDAAPGAGAASVDAAQGEVSTSSAAVEVDRTVAPGRGETEFAGAAGSQDAAGLLETEGTQAVSEATTPRQRDYAGVEDSAIPSNSEAAQSISAQPSDPTAEVRIADQGGADAAQSVSAQQSERAAVQHGSVQKSDAQGLGDEAGGQGDADLLRAVEGAWGEIRAKVREFGPTVQALLSGASVARIEGEVIVFAHQHAPLAQRLSDPRNVEAVRSAVRAVLGSDHPVRWEAGGAAPRPAAAAPKARGRGQGGQQGANAPGRESGNPAGRGSDAPAPPRFSRPSQARAAADPTAGAGQRPAPSADTRSFRGDDDIPPPDFPDLPDDPGPMDYPPIDGVPPPSTPEEEQEMLAESQTPVAPGDRRDPDEVALELLKSELGATRLDG
ncbi:DNA polymerase III subunit gamma and tau [Nocardia anaemiae]|uniref:DNA polymerase III subunit gamma and tau n=1 Tax=Nocardia anaemiae TaxID=263910 RepID=UPI0007C68739|nr:DNA polymerase III subunit gamma and tau [Nocardia anaemiae]